ncbi:hypothetical protein GXB85_12290 [Cellulomonas sp. APG4]|uniref:hypothetical protein n=1 Tax=Cellulomonas sp. APG4 TaxID=1538656 RepID=UPI00137982B0|nr:hypothetical protein [Cellulomonas sp. APG4]NCT91725.1 hypothetical protein [Cellulomonas sp. APG4]
MTTTPSGARPGRGRRTLGPGLTAFLVVDVLLVLAFVLVAVNAPQRGGPAQEPTTEAAEPETTPEASAPEDPTDAEALTAFVLPSGNIHCAMDETSATCTILSFSYDAPEAPEDCAGTVGNVLRVDAESEEVTFPCVEGEPPAAPKDAPELAYGEASSVGDMTCQSSRNGAFCRHNPSGAGFSLARAGYTIF